MQRVISAHHFDGVRVYESRAATHERDCWIRLQDRFVLSVAQLFYPALLLVHQSDPVNRGRMLLDRRKRVVRLLVGKLRGANQDL